LIIVLFVLFVFFDIRLLNISLLLSNFSCTHRKFVCQSCQASDHNVMYMHHCIHV
jgi:hypothetical protein